MRIESVMQVELPGSLMSAAVTADVLTKIISEAFARNEPQYEKVYVYTSGGPLIFRRNEAKEFTREYVSAKISEAIFYRIQDDARKLSGVRRGW